MDELGECSNLSTTFSSEAKDDLIQQRIQHIRKQLDDTYNLFINAKDALSTITFDNLNDKLCNEAVMSHDAKDVLVVGADSKIDVAKSLENLNNTPRGSRNIGKYEDIPELNKFFNVMADLKEGIKNISKHQESIAELNSDIDNIMDQVSVRSVEDQLESISLEDTTHQSTK